MTDPQRPSLLPAETIGVRFGGRYSKGKFHIVDLPEAPGPWRAAADFRARCGAELGGGSIVSASLENLRATEQEAHRSLVCKRCENGSQEPTTTRPEETK